MRRASMVLAATLMFIVTTVAGVTLVAAPASATTAGCYGASCNGRNPSGLCDDGITVGAMNVNYGMLELRYSRSCKANWGRYTPYWRDVSFLASQQKSLWARVTVWNPGNVSYGPAYHQFALNGSTWSQMTDGRPTACTGVEAVVFGTGSGGYGTDSESQGWQWGPCY